MQLLDISTWWQNMIYFEKIFWVIAIVFSLLFLIQAIMSFAGGDSDTAMGDADVSIDTDDGLGHQFFTIKNLIAFFTIFGWTGIAFIKGGMGQGITIAAALVAGVLMVAMMMLLFRSMSRLKHSGTLEISNALNKIGETYLVIPAQRSGYGKVHIKVQGSLQELQAITDEVSAIPTGKLVKVVEILNNNILIVSSKLS
jgi:membrane protein implicated in regulation of membrane protease activity